MIEIAEIALKHGLENETVISILREAVQEELGYPVDSDYISENGRIIFTSGAKRIRFSPLLARRISEKFERMILLAELSKSGTKIISGTIDAASKAGLAVNTRYGFAFAPMHLLVHSEKMLYVPGAKLDFFVYSVKKKKIVLSRRARELTLHVIREVLADLGEKIEVYSASRKFGQRLKIYASGKPGSQALERLEMLFPEKISFVTY